MKLSDLKTGWRVELRNGDTYIVLRNCATDYYGHQDIMFVNIDRSGSIIGDDYSEDIMTHFNDYDYDIMRVYKTDVDARVFNKNHKGTLVWERSLEPKNMTLKEIEDKLGYSVRIVG